LIGQASYTYLLKAALVEHKLADDFPVECHRREDGLLIETGSFVIAAIIAKFIAQTPASNTCIEIGSSTAK